MEVKHIIDTKTKKKWQQTLNQWESTGYSCEVEQALPKKDGKVFMVVKRIKESE